MQQLLRTSLFSLFAFLLAAGMAVAPASAQDIVIDQDDGETIDGELDAATNNDVVEIVASTYDEEVTISTSTTSLSAGESLTIQAAADGTDDDVRIDQLEVFDNITVTVQSAGNGGFVNLREVGAAPASFNLANGTVDLSSQSALELADGIRVRQTGNGTLNSNSPTFNGAVAATLDVGSGALDLSSDPNLLPGSSEDTEVEVTGSGNAVTLPSDITIANVTGVGVSNALQVSNSGAEVKLNGGPVTGTVDNTSGGTITVDQSVTFQALVDQSTGSGTFTANAGVDFEGEVDNSGSGTVDFQSGTSTYDRNLAGEDFNNSGGTVNVADGATLKFDDTSGGTVTVLTNNGSNGVTGSGTLQFTGASSTELVVDAGGNNDNPLNPDIDADVDLTILDNGGTAADANQVTTGSITADGTVTLGDGSSDGEVGTVDINGGITLNDGSDVDVTDAEVNLAGGLTQNTSNTDFISNTGTDLTLDGSEAATLGHVSIFTVGSLTVNKSGSPVPTTTISEAVDVQSNSAGEAFGDVTVSSPLTLGDNLILSGTDTNTGAPNGEAGTLDISATLTQNNDPQGNETFIIVTGESKNVTATGQTVRNLRVNPSASSPGDPDLTLRGNLTVDRKLELLNGGIDDAGTNDLSPGSVSGITAEIERDLANDTGVDASVGSFNTKTNDYDLTITASSAAADDFEDEFGNDLRDLTVEADATPQLTSNTDANPVNGTLTVNSGGQIGDDGAGGTRTLELAGSEETHSIVGTVAQNNSDVVTIDVTGSGATIEGSTDEADAATIEALTANATGVSISSTTPLQQIDGDVTVSQGAGLDLALSAADGEGVGDDDADGTDDRTVEGDVTANGSLTLSSPIELMNNGSTVLQVNGTGTGGSVAFASSDLFVTGEGATVDANSDGVADETPFSSSGGRLVFDKNESGAEQSFGTAGEIVPRVAVNADPNDTDGDLLLTENVATDTELDVDEEIDLDGNTFEVSGDDGDGVTDVALARDIIDGSGGGVFKAVGTTVTAEAGVSITEFTVDPGSGNTVDLRSDENTTARTVTVGTAFELASGAFDHGQNELEVTGSFTYSGDGNEDPEIAATDGFVDIAGGSFTLNNPMDADNLRVSSSIALGAQDLGIQNELELDDQLDNNAGNGDVVMDNNTTVQRLQGTRTGGTDNPLTAQLSVENSGDTYDIEYGEGQNAGYNSDQELVDGQVSKITIQSGNEVFLTDRVSANPIVVDELVLDSGDLDYARQLEISDQGTVTRRPGAELADVSSNTEDNGGDAPSDLASSGTFTLVYDGDDGAAGNTITADSKEFTSDVSSLKTTLGDANAGNSHNVDIGLTRTVSSLTVNNETSGSDTDINGSLTVTGDADVKAGGLGGSGTVELTGSNSTFTATGSGVDVGADLTLANALDVESGATVDATVDVDGKATLSGGSTLKGDITTQGDVELSGSGNTFGSTSTDVTFDADTDQSLNLNGQSSDVKELHLNKTTPSNAAVPTVTVTSGTFTTNAGTNNNGLDLDNGLLVVQNATGDDANALDLQDNDFDRSDVDPASGDTSHVVGNVTRILGNVGTSTAPSSQDVGDRIDETFPVGSANAAYRPLQLIFPSGNSLDQEEITIGHVQGATPETNLPIETASGVILSTEKPGYYWRTETGTNLGIGQDFEIAATATGLALDTPLEDHRLIRQEEASGADWELQGDDGRFNNTGDSDRAIIRNDASSAGLSPLPRRLTVGVPARAPTFTTTPTGDQTDEAVELTATFDAETQDPGTSDPAAVSFSVDAPSAIEDSVSIDDTGELSYTPDFDDAGSSPYDITVIAEDDVQGTTTESTFEATVNNVPAPPAYTAPITDETVDEGNEVTKTFEAELQDPASNGNVQYSVDAPAEIADSIEVDQQTGEFSYTAGFEDDANSPYDVTAKATDSDVQATKDSTFTITVNDVPQAPIFASSPGDQTLDEGTETTVDFVAEKQDPNSSLSNLTFDADLGFASVENTSISGDQKTATILLAPGFDDAGDLTLTVTAEDENGETATSEIGVTINDTGQQPTVATSAGPQTIQEDDDEQANVTVDFTGTAEDPDSDGSDLSFDTNLDFATVSNTSVSGDDKTATIALDPGLDDAQPEDYTLTVTATDNNASTSGDESIAVTVEDNPQAPAFVDGEAPSDRDVVAEEVAPSANAPSGNIFEVQAEVTDPGSSIDQLSASAGESWADAAVTDRSSGVATIEVTLTPPFDVVKTAAGDAAGAGNPAVDGTEDVSITLTDGGAETSFDEAATVDLRYDRKIGDVDDSGTFSNADASQALAIAVGKDTRNGVDLDTDRRIRAADFISPNATVSGDNISWPNADTLDANRDHVNSFDALRIFRKANPSFFGSGATAAAFAQTSANGQSPSDAVRVGELERKDGTAVVPILLSKNASGVQATDIEVTLTDGASVKNVRANTPDGWMSSYSVTDEGVLKLGMMGSNALTSGRIATVRLDANGTEEPVETGTYQLNGAEKKDLAVETVPSEFALKSNYPNPVETSTTIEYELTEARSVTMEVYNTLGQKVATLVDEEKEAGSHTVNWEAGSQVASGVYFYRIEAGDFTETKRITVVR